jgi:glycosyltransferase involved in cell wall biosynthesis
VISQDYQGSLEVVVVFDLDAQNTPNEVVRLAERADVVEFTGGQRRGGYARNHGVARSSGQWIAFLDDDDEWHPNKLRLQMAAALDQKAIGWTPVVGSRVKQIVTRGHEQHVMPGIPARLIQPRDRIEDYLFVGRRPGAKRASFFTSTILVERAVCDLVQWDASLVRHQDWDWLIRASQIPNLKFSQVEEDLVSYYVGSHGSISAGAAWEDSFEWARKELAPISPRVYVDFLAAQTLRYALQKRDWAGVRSVVAGIRHSRQLPNLGPIAIGMAGLLPRTTLENLMRKIR